MINEWLQQVLFELSGISVTIQTALLFGLFLLFAGFVQQFVIKRWLGGYLRSKAIPVQFRKKTLRLIYFTLLFSLCYAIFLYLGWNPILWQGKNQVLNLGHLLGIAVLWSWTWLLDLILVRIFLQQLFEPSGPKQPVQTVLHQTAVSQDGSSGKKRLEVFLFYTAILLSLSILSIDLSFFDGKIGRLQLSLKLSQILIAAWVFVLARLGVWIIVHFVFSGVYKRKQINIGMQYAINQLFNYLIFFFALLFALNLVGMNITLIASGAAALLLGVGLGLQQTFNDFFSGLILLFERSVEVGDVVEIDGLVGKVRRIGLRTSIVQTRDNRSVIVPNSKLVVNNVTNWSHDDEIARFSVSVGVAYGSDTATVKDILLQAARAHPKILQHPEPIARFTGFGDSSLDFELLFWSAEFMRIEDVKSDLRFAIDQAFRTQQVVIPFPQRDLWLRNFPPPAAE